MISKIFNPDIERGVILSRGSVFFKLWVQWVVGGRHGSATRLGVPRTTLISKMRRLGIGAARAECAAWAPRYPKRSQQQRPSERGISMSSRSARPAYSQTG